MKYQLLDCGNFKKLEQIGPYKFIRPAAGAVWSPQAPKLWKNVSAEFERDSAGQGEWESFTEIAEPMAVDFLDFKLLLKMTGFGHLGVFAEQLSNWQKLQEASRAFLQSHSELKVLNLFAYTGGSTLACAAAGAEVVHLDASKTSVNWARENAAASGLADKPVRWIVEDVQNFVKRELRRGTKYQGIILDPPTYGRGAKNQLWKIEEHLQGLMHDLKELMAEEMAFVALSCHSQGYTPVALENMLRADGPVGGKYSHNEMLLKCESGYHLPSGAGAFWSFQ